MHVTEQDPGSEQPTVTELIQHHHQPSPTPQVWFPSHQTYRKYIQPWLKKALAKKILSRPAPMDSINDFVNPGTALCIFFNFFFFSDNMFVNIWTVWDNAPGKKLSVIHLHSCIHLLLQDKMFVIFTFCAFSHIFNTMSFSPSAIKTNIKVIFSQHYHMKGKELMAIE